MNQYDVGLYDPPWDYEVWSKDTGQGRSAEAHYPTMTIDEICALPVGELFADNAALFLWVTMPSMFENAPRVFEAWNFTYRTTAFVWVKAKRDHTGFHFGMGHYTRANAELCLLGVRGSMPVADKGVGQLVYAPVTKHSQKPEEVHQKIERLYPGKRYLEGFARRPYPGWDVFGNEVENSISLNGAKT